MIGFGQAANMKELLSDIRSSEIPNAEVSSDYVTSPTKNTAMIKVFDSNTNIEDEVNQLAAKVAIPITNATNKVYENLSHEENILFCACGCGFEVTASYHYCKLCKKKWLVFSWFTYCQIACMLFCLFVLSSLCLYFSLVWYWQKWGGFRFYSILRKSLW